MPVTPSAPIQRTDAEMLAAVREAIYRISVHGQSYSFDGVERTQADLGALRKMEADLANRVAAQTAGRGGIRSYGVVF